MTTKVDPELVEFLTEHLAERIREKWAKELKDLFADED